MDYYYTVWKEQTNKQLIRSLFINFSTHIIIKTNNAERPATLAASGTRVNRYYIYIPTTAGKCQLLSLQYYLSFIFFILSET